MVNGLIITILGSLAFGFNVIVYAEGERRVCGAFFILLYTLVFMLHEKLFMYTSETCKVKRVRETVGY